MSDKYDGVNSNGQYELVITNLKATFFDVILREDGILGKLERQLEIEVNEEKKKELQVIINKKTETLNNTMKLVNELVAQVESLDAITKSLSVFEDKKVVVVHDNSDKKIEKDYKKDLEDGLKIQQGLEDSVQKIEEKIPVEHEIKEIENNKIDSENELEDDVVRTPLESAVKNEEIIPSVALEQTPEGHEIKEVIPDKIEAGINVAENNIQEVSGREPLFGNDLKETVEDDVVKAPIIIESETNVSEKKSGDIVPEIKVEPIVVTVDEKKGKVVPDVKPIVVPSFNDDVVKAEIEPVVSDKEKVVVPVSVEEDKAIEEKSVESTEPVVLVNETEKPVEVQAEVSDKIDDGVNNNVGLPRLRRTTGDTIKAILVTENQGNKLEESLKTQKSLLSIRDMLNGNEETVNTTINVNDKSDEQVVTEASIESMLEQANLLYKNGKIAEAKQMYDEISVLNQTLQKSDSANNGVVHVKA